MRSFLKRSLILGAVAAIVGLSQVVSLASTEHSRNYNWVTDRDAGIPITASKMDDEFDDIVTKLNQKVVIKGSAPSSPIAGMFWYDSANKILKEYRNNEWVVNGAVHIGTSAPSTLQDGDMWHDTSNDILKIYDGSSWITIPSVASLAQGDLIYGSSSSGFTALNKSTTESHYLSNQGSSNNPQWERVDLNNGTVISGQTAGDLIVASSTVAWLRVPVGADDTVLTSNGSTVVFEAVTNHIPATATEETWSASSTSDNVTLEADKTYLVRFYCHTFSTDGVDVVLRFNDSSGSSYNMFAQSYQWDGTLATRAGTGQTGIILHDNVLENTNGFLVGTLFIDTNDSHSGSEEAFVNGDSQYKPQTGTEAGSSIRGSWTGGAVTSMELAVSSGTFSGQIRVYELQ